MDLTSSRVVVTGAAGGIGAALARRFHADGASVVVADTNGDGIRSVAAELDALRPGTAFSVVADLSTENGNRSLVEEARRLLGGIDLFVANAGVGLGTLLEVTSEDDWATSFDVNLHAHRWAARALLPEWLERGSGYFCSTASAAGLLAQIGSAPYSVSKHAAVAFAEWMSITYGDRGVRVSCLCPQGVNTAMLTGGDLGDNAAGDVVRASGDVLEPEQVADIVAAAIADERFLILPHPQVADFETKKVADRDRWIAGMRRLQRRVLGEL
ncbi:MAG: SDR family NAD(P)-dependent oxidoreductase [Actinomycetota bacterium]|nr:SDR family NAD(P)-dependent oxidoreductase [Actinomycetota bacterium]MDA2971065.1 SDR family NAD(P)-dependent oxidoreductase [Actinomycetota bacterium]MDA3000849.1 SDR family NAD(P)-dependent oxidoreductase [Actinomycetota bacterium]